jgi:hypothetical protein
MLRPVRTTPADDVRPEMCRPGVLVRTVRTTQAVKCFAAFIAKMVHLMVHDIPLTQRQQFRVQAILAVLHKGVAKLG